MTSESRNELFLDPQPEREEQSTSDVIEVLPDDPDRSPAGAVDRDGPDPRLYLACAVVVAVAFVAMAAATWASAQATQRQACISGVQMMMFSVSSDADMPRREWMEDALTDCGVEIPPVGDADRSGLSPAGEPAD